MGCNPQPVEILANSNVVWASQLGGDALYLDKDLGISQHTQPPEQLTVNVNSPGRTNTELLFFPYDPQASFSPLASDSVSEPDIPTGYAGGIVYQYQGGATSYGIGYWLTHLNPDQPAAIKSLYMRQHGECEAAIRWDSALSEILLQVTGSAGCNGTVPIFGCFDFQSHFTKRVATSFLRRVSFPRGQGGFGLYVEGETVFDSPFIDDLSFAGKAGYDVTLSDKGLPVFTVSAGPFARTWNCSPSPFTTCPTGDVENGVKGALASAAGKLNKKFASCMQVQLSEFGPLSCTTAKDCSEGTTASVLAGLAQQEAAARGNNLSQAKEFYKAMMDKRNWTCAPVTTQCASLTGGTPTQKSVCQLKLRAVDLVPMPDEVSLVWYPGGKGTAHPTAAEALYLALKSLGQTGTDKLSRLCSARLPLLTSRAFVKVSK